MDVEDVDPATLLEWLDGNSCVQDEERALQASALERLCMLLLMSSNVDRCFDTYSPDVFVPALCRIFLDEKSPNYVLEVAARALTYFLDVSSECTHRINCTEGALEAISSKLSIEDHPDRTDIDLAEQCLKILDRMSSIEPPWSSINQIIKILDKSAARLHADSIQSALKVLQRICRVDRRDFQPDLRCLFGSQNPMIVEQVLTCLPFMFQRGAPLPDPLPIQLLENPQLLSIMCRRVSLIDAQFVLQAYSTAAPLDSIVADALLHCLYEKRRNIPKYTAADLESVRAMIMHVLRSDAEFAQVDPKLLQWTDDHGHSVLCWATALGSTAQVKQLLRLGADPTEALHVAACTDKVSNGRALLEAGANFEALDDSGRTALSISKERMKVNTTNLLNMASVFWRPRDGLSTEEDLEQYFEAILSVKSNELPGLRVLYKFAHYWDADQVNRLFADRTHQDWVTRLADILCHNLRASKPDEEKTLLALEICERLLQKHGTIFLPMLSRLGVEDRINKLIQRIEPAEMQDLDNITFPNRPDRQFMIATIVPGRGLNARSGIADRILTMKPFSWAGWFVVVTSEHALLWNHFVVLELSRTSKGRYNCFKDSVLYAVNSDADKKGMEPVDSLDEYIEFMDRLSFALSASVLATSDILPDSGSSRDDRSAEGGQRMLGSWFLQRSVDDTDPSTIRHELCSNLLLTLEPNSNYFVYSNGEVRLTIEGSSELPMVRRLSPSLEPTTVSMASGRMDQRNQEFSLQRLKAKCVLTKVFASASRLIDQFRVQNTSDCISEQTKKFNEQALVHLNENALPLLDILSSNNLTRFELSSSQLVPSLLNCPIESIFKPHAGHPGITALVQTLVSNLDDFATAELEEWPVTESRTSRFAVRQLGNHVRMPLVTGQMNYSPEWNTDEKRLVCPSRAEATLNPFICIQQLKEQLATKFICSWYQQPRAQLTFVNQIKQNPPVDLTGRVGVVKWVGTNGLRCEWVDPMKAGLMKVWSSRYGGHEHRRRTHSGKYLLRVGGGVERSNPNASVRRLHFQVDTGLYIRPTEYQLLTSSNDGEMKRPFGWTALVSRDAKNWSKADIIDVIKMDNGERYVFAPLDPNSDAFKQGFRHFRFEQSVPDESEYGFDLGHFELFGSVVDVCNTELNRTSALHRFAQSLRISRRPSGRWAFRLPNSWASGARSDQSISEQLRALEAVTFELASGGHHLEDGANVLQNLFLSCRRRLQQREGQQEGTPAENVTEQVDAIDEQENIEQESNVPHPFIEENEVEHEDLETAQTAAAVGNYPEFDERPTETRLDEQQLIEPTMASSSVNVDNSHSSGAFTPCDAELMMMLMMEQGSNEFEGTHDEELVVDEMDDAEEDDDEDGGDEAEDTMQDAQCEDEDEADDCEDELIVDEDDTTEYDDIYNYSSQPLSTVFIDRKSKALAPAFDPRPGQFNVSSTQDLDSTVFANDGSSSSGRSRRSRRQRRLEKLPQLSVILEFNLSHPDVKNLKVTQIQSPMLETDKCLMWHMRKALYQIPANQRNELSKHLWEKIFRLRLDIVDNKQIDECSNSDSVQTNNLNNNPLVQVLKRLYIALQHSDSFYPASFHSPRLTTSVEKMLSDALTVASDTQPAWMYRLVHEVPFLIPLELRIKYFRAMSFGTTRSLIWTIQNADLSADFNTTRVVGRLRRERSSIRRNCLLTDALTLLEYHCRHKAELEINWKDEDGTGLGPTMEFYTLLTEELQRTSLAMWLTNGQETDAKFVHTAFGLFPAPYPPDHKQLEDVCRLFRLLGILIGKSLQDDRQCCELNLSEPLLKLLCPPLSLRPVDDRLDLLTYDDFCVVQPERARIFNQLRGQSLNDMCLYFNYAPSSKQYNYMDYPLGGHSADEPITQQNFDEYVRAVVNFVLRDGIRAQVEALIDGITKVVPIESLCCFLPNEFSLYLCGDNAPSWTREELLQYIEPKNGYNRDSRMYLYLIDVFESFSGEERRQVLQFITGCRTLPIGGLAALNPRLTVAKKDGSGYPSVNTCNHFLKLPEYDSAEELKEKLLLSCNERGFYFN